MCWILYKQKQSKAREPMRAQWLLRVARGGRYAYLLQDPVKRFGLCRRLCSSTPCACTSEINII